MIKQILNWLTENRTPKQTIAKNTFWLFAGQLTSRLFRAAIVVYAARVLGASSWGAFSYALGIVTFLTVFSDIGINGILTRESARQPERRNAYLGTAFAIKAALLALVFVAITFLSPYLTNIPEAKALLPILVFVFAFDTLRDLGSSFARSLERMEIEAAVGIATNALIMILGFAALWIFSSSRALALAYAAGSGAGAVAMFRAIRTPVRRIARSFDRTLVKTILMTAWPFGLLGMMGAVMLNTDIIMLGWLRSPEEVGYYAAAQKLIQLLYVLPTFLASSMFPLLARLAREGPEHAGRSLLERSVAGMVLASLPIAAVGVTFGRQIIAVIFGPAYAPAAPAFQMLMLTVLLTYPSILIGNAIFAYGRERLFAWVVLLAAGMNIFWNALFIPRWGITGAAAATLLTQLVTDSFIWYNMRRVNGFRVLPAIKRYLGLARIP